MFLITYVCTTSDYNVINLTANLCISCSPLV